MKLLGLTGGIGMGKSTATDLLRQRGLPVVDTDLLAREIVEPGQPALTEIVQHFGPEFLDSDGRLRRDKLADRVFADESERRQLEALTHPRIRERWMVEAASWRASGQPIGIVVIPLLFETGSEGGFDALVCIACSAATQQQRLRARGWTHTQVEQRLRAQWPVERKVAASHYVVWTEGTLQAHAEQLDLILAAQRR
jgi:dephospho-CoA kinase